MLTYSTRRNAFEKNQTEWRLDGDTFIIRDHKGRETRENLANVVSVRLAYTPTQYQEWRHVMVLNFRDGKSKTVENSNFKGPGEFENRSKDYSPFVLAVVAVVLVLVAALVTHVEGIEKVVNDIAELALVVDIVLETIELTPGAALDEAPPQVDEPARRRRWWHAGEAFADQHRHRFLDRRIGAVGNFVKLAAMELVVEHRRQVLGDTLHAPGADRLDPGLLYRFEHRPRLLADRQQTAVDGVVVAGHAQRDRVGMAAHDRGFRRGELARRLGQSRLAADHAGPLGGERDLELRLARDRAQAAGDGALERLGRRFLRGNLGFDVCRHHNTLVIQTRR